MTKSEYNTILTSIHKKLNCDEHILHVHSMCVRKHQINFITLHKPSLSSRAYIATYNPESYTVTDLKSNIGEMHGKDIVYDHPGLT
jgi:hypothetical protein